MPLDWIKFLPIEISDIEEVVEPAEPLKPNDEILGYLDDDLKRLWTLRVMWQQKADDLTSRMNLNILQHDEENQAQVQEAAAKSHVLLQLFWVSVQDYFKTWHIRNYRVGVRKGFAVVKYVPQNPQVFGFGDFGQ